MVKKRRNLAVERFADSESISQDAGGARERLLQNGCRAVKADSFGSTLAFPALLCWAFTCLRYAAGAEFCPTVRGFHAPAAA
jgi:hypothetical protein